jgi:hypothetical protein
MAIRDSQLAPVHFKLGTLFLHPALDIVVKAQVILFVAQLGLRGMVIVVTRDKG